MQKKKAEKMTKKKYHGFGETKQVEDADQRKKKEEKELKKKEIIKKAQVSKNEQDLISELLKIGDSAVAESLKTTAAPAAAPVKPVPTVHSVAAIAQFEECEALGEYGHPNLSEELDRLFELA